MSLFTSVEKMMPRMLFVASVLALATHAQVAPFADCNQGPMHHTHLVLPLANTEADCALSTAKFFLSHGATFFCPHTWDVKLLASVVEDDARQVLCSSYFSNYMTAPMHAFRPTLDQGGLPAEALGQLASWTSPVIYHVNSFDEGNPDAGPDDGWDVDTIYNKTVTVTIDQVLYSRQLDLQPRPPVLTYLVHAPVGAKNPVLSHYISTGGDSGFDHILTAEINRLDGEPLVLRSTWATYLVLNVEDTYANRFISGAHKQGVLSVYDPATNLPVDLPVSAIMHAEYYYGRNDGFADFVNVCPATDGPDSPTMCLNGASS